MLSLIKFFISRRGVSMSPGSSTGSSCRAEDATGDGVTREDVSGDGLSSCWEGFSDMDRSTDGVELLHPDSKVERRRRDAGLRSAQGESTRAFATLSRSDGVGLQG